MAFVAVYCRISRDADGRSEGVKAQTTKGSAYAAEHWPDLPVRVFCDNDLSAATPGTRRPAFEELVAAVRRGDVAQVVTAEQSRLTRQPSEWEDLVVVLTRAGIGEVHTYRKGVVAVSGSRLMGRIMAAVDAEEVERLRARVTERLEVLAAEGRPPGGSSYGYRRVQDPDGRKALVIDEAQAAVIRGMVAKVLAGWSLTRIAADLTEHGVPTARGGRWATTTVRSTLSRPTIAGLRVHRGEVVGAGLWEPIVQVDVWRQVMAILSGPVQVHRPDGSTYTARRARTTGRRYLLTGGVARCGRCGAELQAQQRRSRTGDRSPSYLCSPRNGGCSGIGIAADPLERHVAGRLLTELRGGRFAARLAQDPGEERATVTAGLAAIEARSAELAQMWAAGDLMSGDWQAARVVLEADRADLERRLAGLPVPGGGLDPAVVLDAWAFMNLDERRQVIAEFVASVAVGPAAPGTRRFDPGRVAISWR